MTENNKKRSLWEWLSGLLGREPKNRSELMDVLRDAEEHDILSAENLSMIESVLQVSDMQVREVMVSKAQMIVVEKKQSLEAILPIIIDSGHSRFPIIENDDVVGILLAKDLLPYGFNQPNKAFTFEKVLRPAFFVPQSKRLDILLKEFRINRNHIAIVIDEYGHVAGLITIEDVLEQIVGEIEDEYDIDEEIQIHKHADETYTLKASIPIETFNQYFETNFSNDDYDTLGGVLLQGFGHLPKRGETLELKGFNFKILHSDNRRIHLIEVKK